jgi:hypothetical protein
MNLGTERRRCPPEFQERIDDRFGLNRFGGPKFKIVWGQTETIKMVKLWGGGYEQRLLCADKACWNILRWRPPEVYGMPDLYYSTNFDDLSGLCIVGPYPYEGRYEVVVPLCRKEFSGNRMVVIPFPLCHMIIERALPLLVIAEQATDAEKHIALAEQKEREDKAETEEISDRMMDDLPRWYGPVSYSRQGTRVSHIDRMMEKIQREWSMLATAPAPRRGLRQLPL